MKTTIEIDDELLAAAKRRAEAAGLSVDAFVEEAVREKVVEDRAGEVASPSERAAMLDFLPRGRAGAGAARGEQRHWTREEIYRGSG